MTWTKLGAEFNSECALAGLTDAAYRTHCEAIGWLYEVEDLTCRIPKRLLLRFASSDDAGAAIEQLTAVGYWKDAGAVWVVLHHAAVIRQSIAAQQDKRSRDLKAQHRYRRKVSADVSADVSAGVSGDTVRQTDRRSERPRRIQKQDHEAGQIVVGNLISDRENHDQGQDHSAANSENHRVHHGSDNHSSPSPADQITPVGEQPQTVTRASTP